MMMTDLIGYERIWEDLTGFVTALAHWLGPRLGLGLNLGLGLAHWLGPRPGLGLKLGILVDLEILRSCDHTPNFITGSVHIPNPWESDKPSPPQVVHGRDTTDLISGWREDPSTHNGAGNQTHQATRRFVGTRPTNRWSCLR